MIIGNKYEHSMMIIWSRKRNRDQGATAVAKISVIQAWGGFERRFNGYSKSLSQISAAERFRPLPVIKANLKVLHLSRKLKRNSNVVGGCREYWETLSWCSTMTRGEPRTGTLFKRPSPWRYVPAPCVPDAREELHGMQTLDLDCLEPILDHIQASMWASIPVNPS
jgi:hypothetical protein